MFSIEIATGGLEFEVAVQKLGGVLRQRLVERLADVVWASAFWGAPRRSGYLASTIVKEVGSCEAVISVLASYAMYVVKGTRPHVIRPVNASVLAFEAADGRVVFAPLVCHPGTQPNLFLQDAAAAAFGKVTEVFAELWVEMMG